MITVIHYVHYTVLILHREQVVDTRNADIKKFA